MTIHDFPHDLDEIIERGIEPYRPVLSRMVIAEIRDHLRTILHMSSALSACIRMLDAATRIPWPRVEGLTPSQVALLGGTAPTRVPEMAAHELALPVDGGSKESADALRDHMIASFGAAQDLIDQHPEVTPAHPDDAARALSELVDDAVVASYAAMLGVIFNQLEPLKPGEAPSDQTTAMQPYFAWALLAFQNVDLDRADTSTFDHYYMRCFEPADIAKHRGHAVEIELDRRLSFIRRLGPRLRREIAQLAEDLGSEPARADPSSKHVQTFYTLSMLGPRRKRTS